MQKKFKKFFRPTKKTLELEHLRYTQTYDGREFVTNGYWVLDIEKLKVADKRLYWLLKSEIQESEHKPSLDTLFSKYTDNKPSYSKVTEYPTQALLEHDTPMVLLTSKNVGHNQGSVEVRINAYFWSLFESFAYATPVVSGPEDLVVFKNSNEEIIGAVMPLRS